MTIRSAVCLGILALLVVMGRAEAQVGTTTDVLTGVVRDSAGQPVAEAIVEVTSMETQITRTGKTDPRGRYTILFPDGGGQYRLVVRAIGKTPVVRTIARQADEDRLITNITLGAVPTRLQEIVVRGRPGPVITGDGGPPTPGTIERAIPADRAARLPIDASDLTVLATLAPGVVSVSSNDSTAAGFSVAGQRPSSNSTTLDGLTFGGAGVPQDAVRNTRVITNSYDVARGQFSGGQVATTTMGGTNSVRGTGNYGLRDRDLSVSTGDSTAFAQGFTQHQLSAGIGGPLVRDKIFYFVSGQGRFRDDGLQSLLSASPSSLNRLGLAPDSAARFLSFLEDRHLPLYADDTLTSRATDDLSSIARFDFLLSQGHTLTLRGDWRHSQTEPTGVGQLSVPSSGGITRSKGGGGMATLSSRFGTKVINEFRAYVSGSSQRGVAFEEIPQGRVQVVSTLDDGTQTVSNLSFGGNSGLSQRRSSTGIEISEELSLIPGSGAHRIKAGLLFNRTTSSQIAASNLTGTFTYTSLGDLYAGTPASFTRILSPSARKSTSINSGLYLGDTWRPTQALQLTLGARLEHSRFGDAPGYNADVDDAFGLRTDRLPRETHFSPRAGFTLTLGSTDQGPPALTLRGGLGEFRSPIPAALAAAAQSATGLPTGETQLFCVGAATPFPNWDAYLADPSSIPETCVGGGGGGPVSTAIPQVTAFASDFGAPRAWRGSFGAQRRMGTWTLGVDLSLARGVSQSGYQDLNLGSEQFTLTAEAGRPVFAPSAAINPASGVAPLSASRLDGRFGQVLRLDSKLGSKSAGVTLSANGITRGGISLQASYTWSRSTDQSSSSERGGISGYAGQTAGADPNAREWATSDFERRHSVLAVVTWPATAALEITGIGRVTSGTPYTPLVGGDINGDGSRNDRAFIFGPASAPDTAIANGMQRLLAGASSGARSCLERQTGTIATRNSCRGPWQPSLDLQVNYRPAWAGLQRRLTISLVTSNLLAGLDQAFHGSDNLHGWGQMVRPSGTLLSVRGFDVDAGRYLYTVNERFGATSAGSNAFRAPFQVGIQLRYTLGVTGLGALMGARGFGGMGDGPRAGGGTGPGGGGDFASRFGSLIPNPIKEVLDLKIGLRLTDPQEKQLTRLSDSVATKSAELAKALQAEMAKLGANPDPARMMAVIRPRMEDGQRQMQAALERVRSILTAEQWNALPERIKNFGRGPGTGERRVRPPGE